MNRQQLILPVLVLESETGDLGACTSWDDLVKHVEEFWDLLEQDFRYWDANARPVHFKLGALRGNREDVELGDPEPEQVEAILDAADARRGRLAGTAGRSIAERIQDFR